MSALPLILATVSYLWLLGLLVSPRIIGPDYSDLRFRTIGVNLIIGCIGVLGAAVFGRGIRIILVLASIWVGILWCYLAVVSSVV